MAPKTGYKCKWCKKLPKAIPVIFMIVIIMAIFLLAWILQKGPLLSLISALIYNGYLKIFSSGGNEVGSFQYFTTALVVTSILFAIVSFIIWLFIILFKFEHLFGPTKDSNLQEIMKGTGKYYYLTLTIIISIIIMYSGTLFLSKAFPAEPLITKGILGSDGSTISTKSSYLNFIDQYDVPCNLNLSKSHTNVHITYIDYQYPINRTFSRQNVTVWGQNYFVLTYDQLIQPWYITIHFNNSDEETFEIANKGVFTKDEYQQREKEKAVWFFAIISLSLFTVFSAMNDLRQIIQWK
jgi:hypothetical protein